MTSAETVMGTEYDTVRVDKDDQVATIWIKDAEDSYEGGGDTHFDFARALNECRGDLDIRVIVVTGEGEDLYVPPPPEHYGDLDDEDAAAFQRLADPKGQFKVSTGINWTHQTMAQIEKPIVTKVNGDAIGFGSTMVWGADFVVAEEGSSITDIHLAMDEIPEYFIPWGVAPGDGGGATVPLHMPPSMVSEYLMFSEPFTGKQLAEKDLIYRAVPADELDEAVEAVTERLLKRSAMALAWTKKIARKGHVSHLNETLGEATAYEMLGFSHMATDRRDQRTLR